MIDQVSHHSVSPSFKCVSLINCRGQHEIFAVLYLVPTLNVQSKCNLTDHFQDANENLILDCGSSLKIYIGADLNIDIAANHPRYKKLIECVLLFLDSLTLEDILRVKHLSQAKFPSYIYSLSD